MCKQDRVIDIGYTKMISGVECLIVRTSFGASCRGGLFCKDDFNWSLPGVESCDPYRNKFYEPARWKLASEGLPIGVCLEDLSDVIAGLRRTEVLLCG